MAGSDTDSTTILMGLFNGAAHVDEQLASIADQSHDRWSLLVSDDGSEDDGPSRITAFASRCRPGQVRLTQGPCRGFPANFLTMITAPETGSARFVALCDQDDVWMPHRLTRGIAALTPFGDAPALYCARTHVCDSQMRALHVSPLWSRPFSLRNALVQNVASGNTIMMNRAMADLAARAVPAALRAGIAAHDWWLYQLATACGAAVVQDDRPVLLYRQHGGNTMGRNDTLAARLNRVAQIVDGTFARWIAAHVAALRGCDDLLTHEARGLLSRIEGLHRQGASARLRALRDLGLYRQTHIGDLALKLAASLGKL